MKLALLLFAVAVKTSSAEDFRSDEVTAALRGSQHGYDISCTNNCVCYDPNCDMSKCQSGCTAHATNTDMSNCQSNCLDYAGNANMQCCTSTCTSHMTGTSMPNCQSGCVCWATCNTSNGGSTTCNTGSGGSGQDIRGWSGSTGSDCVSSDILTVAAEDGKALEPVCNYYLDDSGHVQPYVCSEGPGYACCKAGLGGTVVTDTLGTCTRIPSNSGNSGWTGSPGSDCVSADMLTVAAEDGKALKPICNYFLEPSGHVQPYACSEGPGYACCKAGLGETVITDSLGTCTMTTEDEASGTISES